MLLVSGRVSVPKPLSQIQRGTRRLLQGLSPRTSFGGFGLRTKTSLPERLQATQLKILGIKDADGNAISGTASAGDAGKKVFVTNWEAPSTGRHYIAVGSQGTDLTGTYWISITRKFQD